MRGDVILSFSSASCLFTRGHALYSTWKKGDSAFKANKVVVVRMEQRLKDLEDCFGVLCNGKEFPIRCSLRIRKN